MSATTGTASGTIDAAPAAVALVDATGMVERSTDRFRERHGEVPSLAAHGNEIERVVAGDVDRVTITLDGASAELAAVLSPDGRRLCLLTIAAEERVVGDTANPLFSEPLDRSPALVWLKELDGRYVRINRAYTELLQAEAEAICGRTDAELSPRQSIEGMRLHAEDTVPQEPLELEYTVPAFEGRPALAVLRFALRDDAGHPIAVCGVASPLHEARLARSECARLMRIERWSRLGVSAIVEEILEDWELEAVSASAEAPLGTELLVDTQRARELAETVAADEARIAELEISLSAAEQHVAELETERQEATLREQAAAQSLELERGTVEALTQNLETTTGDLDAAHSRAEQAETALAEQRTLTAQAVAAAEEAEGRASTIAAELEAMVESAAREEEAAASGPRWNASAQRALSTALLGALDWRTALKRVAGTLGTEGGWDAVVAWCPDDRRGVMRCVAMWSGHQELSAFETRTWQHRQDVSGTEFGRASMRSSPTCLLELQSAEDGLLRSAADFGLASALLVPIKSESETIGILELLSSSETPPSGQLTLFVEALALQLATLAQLLNFATQPRWGPGRL